MTTQKQTSKDYFKSLLVIYYALIAGQLFFGIFAVYINFFANYKTDAKYLAEIFTYIIPALFIASIFASITIFNNKLKQAKKRDDLLLKMTDYKAALIIRYAFLEGPSFFSISIFFITGEIYFLVPSLLIILYFLTLKPTLEKSIKDLDPSYIHQNEIKNPDSIIAEFETNSKY